MQEDPLPAFPGGDLHAACIARAAAARRIPTQVVHGSLRTAADDRPWLRLALGDERVFFYRSGVLRRAVRGPDLAGSRNVNHSIVRQTSDKHAMKGFLVRRGVPVPAGLLVDPADPAAAIGFLERIARPVCVKPNGGQRGQAVFPGIADADALAAAFQTAALEGPVVIEAHVAGEAVRMLYAKPDVIGVRVDRPASVVGDGTHSVRDLVAAKNEERLRRALPGYVPIELDAEVHRYLALRDLTLDDVPPAEERVFLRGTSNIPTGGDCLDCRDRLHPSYVTLVERFCREVPALAVAAIDLVIADLGQEARPGNHWVLEVNSAPGLVPFHFPWEGEPQDVSGALLDRLSVGNW